MPDCEVYSCSPKAPKRYLTPLGDKWIIKAKLSIDPNTGDKIAEPGEKVDGDAMIQSYKASTDIATIVARYKAGDESVLNVNPYGLTGDLTVLPKDINDITGIGGLYDQARQNFDKLPEDIKALFDNDAGKFFDSVMNNKIDEILGKYQPKVDDPKPAEEGEGGNE